MSTLGPNYGNSKQLKNFREKFQEPLKAKHLRETSGDKQKHFQETGCNIIFVADKGNAILLINIQTTTRRPKINQFVPPKRSYLLISYIAFSVRDMN